MSSENRPLKAGHYLQLKAFRGTRAMVWGEENSTHHYKIIYCIKKIWIMEGQLSIGFRSIFTVDLLLFLAPPGGSNPTGQSFLFT